jgi:hypothetical protein
MHLIPRMKNLNSIGAAHQEPKKAAYGRFVAQRLGIRADRRCESPAEENNRE